MTVLRELQASLLFPDIIPFSLSVHYSSIHSSYIALIFFLTTLFHFVYSSPASLMSFHVFHSREGRWGTTDDFATSFLHFPPFSTALWDLANSRPVHSLMLSSHLFLCLLCLLPPFTVPCRMVLSTPDERET